MGYNIIGLISRIFFHNYLPLPHPHIHLAITRQQQELAFLIYLNKKNHIQRQTLYIFLDRN